MDTVEKGSFWGTFKDRARSPMYSTFIIAWSIWNWKFIYYLVTADGKLSFEQRMADIHNLYHPEFVWCDWFYWSKFLHLYVIPIVITFLVVYWLDRRVSNNFARYSTETKQKRKDEKTKIENAELVVRLEEEVTNLQSHINIINNYTDHLSNLSGELLRYNRLYLDTLTNSNTAPDKLKAQQNLISNTVKALNERPKTTRYKNGSQII
jgi:hypothetical protein